MSATPTGPSLRRSVRVPITDFVPCRALTPRQREVVQALADDLSYDEIAGALGITYRTVVAHVHAIALLLPGTSEPRERVMRYAVIVAVEQELAARHGFPARRAA